MNTLYQKVKHKEHFKKLFESWEATETIIDNNKFYHVGIVCSNNFFLCYNLDERKKRGNER